MSLTISMNYLFKNLFSLLTDQQILNIGTTANYIMFKKIQSESIFWCGNCHTMPSRRPATAAMEACLNTFKILTAISTT